MTFLDLKENRSEQAIARLRQLLSTAPDNGALLTILGRAYLSIKDVRQAEDVLKQAVNLAPGVPAGYSVLGELYLGENRLDDARLQFERLGERQPQPVGALTMAGMIYQLQGNIGQARKTFERVMAIDEGAAVAANNLAWIYAAEDDHLDRALQLAQTAKAGLQSTPTCWIPSDGSTIERGSRPWPSACSSRVSTRVQQPHLSLSSRVGVHTRWRQKT